MPWQQPEPWEKEGLLTWERGSGRDWLEGCCPLQCTPLSVRPGTQSRTWLGLSLGSV